MLETANKYKPMKESSFWDEKNKIETANNIAN